MSALLALPGQGHLAQAQLPLGWPKTPAPGRRGSLAAGTGSSAKLLQAARGALPNRTRGGPEVPPALRESTP